MSPESGGVDGRRIRARARALAFPRYPGSSGDRRAIARVRSWFEEAGLETVEEAFSYDVRPAFRALRALLVGSAALVAGSAVVALGSPLVGLGLLLTALVAGGMLLGWTPWLERIYRRDGPTETANVVGRRVQEAPPAERRGTIVVLAHHDSKSQNLTLPVRAGCTLGALGGSLTLGGLELAAVVGVTVAPFALGTAAGVAVLSLAVLATLRSGNRSPGGVDNAGSVAIVAELAAPLARRVPEEIELVFLSPGAEEDHMVGVMRWLDRHAADAAGGPLFALNLDGAGIPGRVALLERYGFGRRFSPTLSRIARKAAGELGIPVRSTLLPPGLGVDAIPFAHRGVDCLTLATGSLCPAVLAVHSPGDTADHLDPAALEQAASLAGAMVLRLAGEIIDRNGGEIRYALHQARVITLARARDSATRHQEAQPSRSGREFGPGARAFRGAGRDRDSIHAL